MRFLGTKKKQKSAKCSCLARPIPFVLSTVCLIYFGNTRPHLTAHKCYFISIHTHKNCTGVSNMFPANTSWFYCQALYIAVVLTEPKSPTYTDTGTHSQIHSFQANDVRGIDGNVVCGPYVPHGGPKKMAKEAEEEGRRGWIQTLTWVWYVVPVRSVKLIVGFQDLLKQLGVVFVVEWRVSTQPADRGLLSQIFLLWFNV